GESIFETTSRSARAITDVVAVAELLAPFGSLAEEEIVAVLLSVAPSATSGSTRTTTVKPALSLAAMVSFLQVITPPKPFEAEPTPPPAAPEKDCNRVPAGSVSCHCAKTAGPEPLLLTLIV